MLISISNHRNSKIQVF